MKLSSGQVFISIPIGIETKIKIIAIYYDKNELVVQFENGKLEGAIDIWNLEHSVWAFERGEYKIINIVKEKEINFDYFHRLKNGQIEDDGAYAD